MINVEDILNSYILEFREDLSRHNISEFENLVNSVYTESDILENLHTNMNKFSISFINDKIKPDIYVKYLKRALQNIDNMSIDVEELNNFYSDVYNSLALDDSNLTSTFRSDDDIKRVQPDYLKTVYNDMSHMTKEILDGRISKKDLDSRYFLNDTYLNKMKKRLVDTTYTINDVRDIMIIDSPKVVNVDNIFIQHNVIPFIRSYIPNIAEVRAQIVSTIGKINNLCMDVNEIVVYVINMIDSGQLPENKIMLMRYFLYNMITIIMKLSAYISAILIIKSSCLLYNAKQCVELYDSIRIRFPEMQSILHESVIDGNVTDIDNTTLFNSIINNNSSIVIPHVQKAVGLKKMQIAKYVSKKYNTTLRYDSDIDISKYPYDIRPYAVINKSITDIMRNLIAFKKECDNNETSIDDIVNKLHLNESFSLRYVKVINNVRNVTYYTSDMNDIESSPDILLSLFNDVSNFERNLSIISNNMKRAYDIIDSMLREYEQNLIGSDEVFTNDVKSVIERIMSDYKEYIIHIIRNLLSRLDTLTDLMNDDGDDEYKVEYNGIELSSNDYTLDVYQEKYNEIVENERYIINNLTWQYKRLKSIKERGVDLIREDVKPAKDNGTTPSVEGVPKPDTNDNNETDKTNQSTNNPAKSGNDSNQNDGNKKSLLEKFREFINKMLDKFSKKTKDLVSKNDKWLKSVRNELTNMDTTNVTITVAKYDGLTMENISSNINISINKINSINASNPPAQITESKESCEFYLFPSIPEEVSHETSFAERIKKFYTYGNVDKDELTSYSGEDAKTKITEMIRFCESYSANSTNLMNLIRKLSDAAINKETEIINSSKSKDDNNANKGNKLENAISSATREYCGSIPTVMEKKYLDYYKVLYALTGNKDKDTKPKNNEDNGENK